MNPEQGISPREFRGLNPGYSPKGFNRGISHSGVYPIGVYTTSGFNHPTLVQTNGRAERAGVCVSRHAALVSVMMLYVCAYCAVILCGLESYRTRLIVAAVCKEPLPVLLPR